MDIQGSDGKVRERDWVMPSLPDVPRHPAIDRNNPSIIRNEALRQSLERIAEAAQSATKSLQAVLGASDNAQRFAGIARSLEPGLAQIARSEELAKIQNASQASREFVRASKAVDDFNEASRKLLEANQAFKQGSAAHMQFAGALRDMNRSLQELGSLQASVEKLGALSRTARGADRTLASLAKRAQEAALRSGLQEMAQSYVSPARMVDMLADLRSSVLHSAELRNALIHAATVDYALTRESKGVSRPGDEDDATE